MGNSQLKIPKIYEQCGKPYEAKTVITRFCGNACASQSSKDKKRQAKEVEQKQTILKDSANRIAEIQTRPFISITEATVLLGISKDTIRRLVKSGKISAVNLGECLTRVSRSNIETMFTAVELPEETQKQPVKLQYESNECYTIAAVSEKYGVSPLRSAIPFVGIAFRNGKLASTSTSPK